MKKSIVLLATTCAVLLASPVARADSTKPRLDTSGRNMQPNYPDTALAGKEMGEVLLDVVVGTNGSVEKIALRHSTGFNDLDRSAIDAVMDWHFIPAMENGAPVEGVTTVALAFAPPGSDYQPPKTAPDRDYLPPAIAFDEKIDDYDTRSKKIPCANGTLSANLRILAPGNRVALANYGVSSWLSVESGKQSVYLRTELARFSNVWMQYLSMDLLTDRHFFIAKTMFGEVIPLALSWDEHGHVSTTVDGEHYSVRLLKNPESFSFGTSGGKASIGDATLVCTPPPKPD